MDTAPARGREGWKRLRVSGRYSVQRRAQGIGELPEAWNWLEGWSDPAIDPKILHFTRGTPDMAGHEDVPYAADWWNAYRAAIAREAATADAPAAAAAAE